jgi:hypothetical protein
MSEHYVLDGKKPVRAELMEWARWFEGNREDRIVARTQIGKVLISTVFLGLDHNFGEDGPPLLFETLVFGGDLDGERERYSTWAQAEAGHEQMVAKVAGGTQ